VCVSAKKPQASHQAEEASRARGSLGESVAPVSLLTRPDCKAVGAGKRDGAVPGGTLSAGEHCGMRVTSAEREEGFQQLSLCFGEGGTSRCVRSPEKQPHSPCLVASFNGKRVLAANKCFTFVNRLFWLL